jgi:hypothetical protein
MFDNYRDPGQVSEIPITVLAEFPLYQLTISPSTFAWGIFLKDDGIE